MKDMNFIFEKSTTLFRSTVLVKAGKYYVTVAVVNSNKHGYSCNHTTHMKVAVSSSKVMSPGSSLS